MGISKLQPQSSGSGSPIKISSTVSNIAKNTSTAIYSVTGKGYVKGLTFSSTANFDSAEQVYTSEFLTIEIIADGIVFSIGSLAYMYSSNNALRKFLLLYEIPFKNTLIINAKNTSATLPSGSLTTDGVVELL